jgi:hypothetical protein
MEIDYTDVCELLYSKYPRKEGKVAGFKKLKKMVSDETKLDEFSRAVENYANHIKNNGISKEYTLLFSTFVNGRWQDYVDFMPESKNIIDRVIFSEPELEKNDYYLTLKTVQLHRAFAEYLSLIQEVWTTHDEFIAFLGAKKRWFMDKYHITELKGAPYQDFRGFLTIAIKGEIGVRNRR